MCKCYICDREMSSEEIKFDERIKPLKTEPCSTCLTVIQETAEGKGFKFDDDEVETVDEEFDFESWNEMTEYEHRDDFLFERGYD